MPQDKNKKENIDRFILWILVITVCTSNFIFIMINLFEVNWSDGRLSALASIVGNIIGGLLTLGGVWLTLHRQEKVQFLSSFPIKLQNMEEIEKYLWDTTNEFLRYIGTRTENVKFNLDYVSQKIEEKQEKLVNKSSSISVEAYEYTSSFFDVMKTYIQHVQFELKSNGRLGEDYFQSLNLELYHSMDYWRKKFSDEKKHQVDQYKIKSG